jgi:hypothetical protein
MIIRGGLADGTVIEHEVQPPTEEERTAFQMRKAARSALRNPVVIPGAVFIERVAPYYAAFVAYAQQQLQSGNAAPALYIEKARIDGAVYPGSTEAKAFKAAVVSANLISQANADALFAAP